MGFVTLKILLKKSKRKILLDEISRKKNISSDAKNINFFFIKLMFFIYKVITPQVMQQVDWKSVEQ